MCGISLGFEEKRGLAVTLSSEILVDPERKKKISGKGHSSTFQTNMNLYSSEPNF